MTAEDFKKIEDLIEDASWRTIAFVALLLGHYWVFGVVLLMPLFRDFLRSRVAHYRAEKERRANLAQMGIE